MAGSGGLKGFGDILVPLDFSDPSRRIFQTALQILADGGTLTLLHVVESLPAVTEGTYGIYAHRKDVEKMMALARERLEDYAREHPGIAIQTRVGEGKPATVILEAVAQLEPDLIVLGTHGRSRLDHLLIGSVAERVLRRAPCPVLCVRF